MTDLPELFERVATILLALAAAPFIATMATAIVLILGMTFTLERKNR